MYLFIEYILSKGNQENLLCSFYGSLNILLKKNEYDMIYNMNEYEPCNNSFVY